MTLNKKLFSLITLLFLVALLAACGQQETSGKTTDEESASETTDTSAETEATEEEEEDEEAEEEEVDVAAVYQSGLEELAKVSEGAEVDFQKVTDLYNENLQSLVQQRDSQNETTIDQQILAALSAGADGSLDGSIVKQIFDKLLQNVFYNTIKAEFNEVTEYWGDTEEVNAEIEEAKEYYAILKGTVEKRDNAYGTKLVDQIDAGFNEIEQAIANDDELGFQLGKQLVDKTLMKTFYLATGALENGYASKVAKAVEAGELDKARAEQAEGWAFYQSIKGYITRHSEEDGNFIEQQFNLETDAAELDPTAVNDAFVRGFAQIAFNEFKESEENITKDKGVITALEGALFINIIDGDIKRILGEEAFVTLEEQANSYLEDVKAGNKDEALATLEEMKPTLSGLLEQGK
ncbi:hypothetical protein [Aquibacillus salsiterrae]|uniref:DUF3829 domain-containing protein n=1 Tax=Aquibacillus salsiterrae TaxID=2950439 RepID=A0A9X3WB78_9BACI|nr:hypothetical protein [Aquibacillus salsiterrae]MDC3415857.1 hypothetical protein [Aquibacillus salsiterrae]